MTHFDFLNKKIQENNKIYLEITKQLKALEEKTSIESKEYKDLEFEKWQFSHDYATEISDYILQNFSNITKTDVELFDLIPHNIYNRIPGKTQIIINSIHKNCFITK